MKAAVEKVEFVGNLMSALGAIGEETQLRKFLVLSQESFCGKIDGKICCIWGLITPTILSNYAYLWLWHNNLVREHKFIFVRYSQRCVEVMLNQFPTIVGHVKPHAEESKRWLRWLGAEFGGMDSGLLTFSIRKKDG